MDASARLLATAAPLTRAAAADDALPAAPAEVAILTERALLPLRAAVQPAGLRVIVPGDHLVHVAAGGLHG